MYSILIYIIIAFLFYIFTKDVRKLLIEGQTLESYDYQEFQPIVNDEMVNEKLKEHLNKYSDDIDRILKNTIKDENVDSKLVDQLKEQGGDSDNILYNIYVRDLLGQLNHNEHDEQSYQNYLDNYLRFNKNNEIFNKIPYSNNQLDLFENKYKKDIFYSNEYDYMDINDVNERIRKVEDEIKGGKYVKDGVNFPGFISKSDGEVINNMVDSSSKEIVLKDLEFCCDYSMLNLENVSILSNDEKEKVNKRIRDEQFGDDDEEVERHFEYNYPYYTYMKEGGRVYDSLYLNYNKTRNIGLLNL
tara:strand:- start:841 stop:1743 length:903 start_codon:yes stop_codon:yes gene_type:complete